MSQNIVESIADRLSIPHLQKIDPNTQEVKHPEKNSGEFFYQAAIPAVLIALYKFSRIKEGNTFILPDASSSNILKTILGPDHQYAVEKIASYTGVTTDYAASRMENIAKEATEVINKDLPDNAKDEDIRDYFTDQRSAILKYLPAGLQIGYVLHDETIDDRTNKMDGPMSNQMHWIEKLFSFNDRKKEENW
ncbi:hypothetical protein BH09BAC2_BH09BAC2_21200 [soil metagenome]